MSIKNPIELVDYIDHSYLLRKKEITDFLILVNKTETELKETLEKSFVLLLYSHWEGYIKEVSNLYIRYITLQKKTIQELTDNFYDIYLKELLKSYQKNTNLEIESDLRKRILKLEQKFNIDFTSDYYEKFILGVESNLKFEKYLNICKLTNYEFNDEMGLFERVLFKVIHNRNSIAHTGSKATDNSYVSYEDLENMMYFLLEEMKKFKDHIISCIKDRKFLKN
ncbi:MAE_28990/MAE_18760 family HEPN-like nuclease [Cetobacterium sp. ZWU0022]|uniref:MAE_28990/MAE_18760 family HEPN-like nuclease n=1 Tax=Cetobacterium sp. ZWU0022 TaxID=1340502 RepID=UPI000646564E|nr:MAE_28990/MAE_18760 family HEPN-like nuclease [Cetobacterium sp. ZWU0022]